MSKDTKTNQIVNLKAGFDTRENRTMRVYKTFVKRKYVRKKILQFLLTPEENIARQKRLFARQIAVSKPETKKGADIRPDSLVGERDILWICDITRLRTINILNDPTTFSTDFMYNITTFGTVLKSTLLGSLEIFVIDEGTGTVSVVFDKTRHIALGREIKLLENLMKSDCLFPEPEKRHILKYMSETTSLLESTDCVKVFDNVVVFGHLSQKFNSAKKIIVASHVFHIDLETMCSLSCQLASKLRHRNKSYW